MRAACGQTHLGKVFLIGNFCLFGFELWTLDPCSAAMNGAIEHARQRLIDHAKDALAILSEADLDCEIAVAVDETVRAVERIDHPHA